MRSREITLYSDVCVNVNIIFSSDPSTIVSSFFYSRMKIFEFNKLLPK